MCCTRWDRPARNGDLGIGMSCSIIGRTQEAESILDGRVIILTYHYFVAEFKKQRCYDCCV